MFLFIEAAAVIYVAFTSITENSKVIDLNVWNAFGVETQDILQERVNFKLIHKFDFLKLNKIFSLYKTKSLLV